MTDSLFVMYPVFEIWIVIIIEHHWGCPDSMVCRADHQDDPQLAESKLFLSKSFTLQCPCSELERKAF